mgnify:CR=1 FL=1
MTIELSKCYEIYLLGPVMLLSYLLAAGILPDCWYSGNRATHAPYLHMSENAPSYLTTGGKCCIIESSVYGSAMRW